MPTKLRSISLALTVKSNLSALNQVPGRGSAASAERLSAQLISRSCNSPSASDALIHCRTFLGKGRLSANSATSSTNICGDENPNSLISPPSPGGFHRKVMGLKCSRGAELGLSMSRHASDLVLTESICLSVD